IFRVEFAWLIGIGEERDRHFRTDQDDVLEASQYAQRLVDDIGDAFDRDAAAAALCACIEALCDEPRAGLLGDLAGECQAILAHRPAGQQHERRFARAQHSSRLFHSISRGRRRPGWRRNNCRSPSFHAVSAGRINVAILPGGWRAAAIANAPSPAIALASGEVLTQCEFGRASPSMSEAKGASYWR